MDILAIETSCDETAASVVRDGRTIISNVVHTQVEEHGLYGGVVPEIASRRHIEMITKVVDKALKSAEKTLSDIDAVAVTAAPGLIGALLVGVNYAKGLALSAGKPLVPVHHLRSHIAANYLSHSELKPPFIALVVSGGHTHIVKVDDYTSFKIIGKTCDDAAGECFDKAARAMGLPYPGGVSIDKMCKQGDASRYQLPWPKVPTSEYDFSFSGLKTAVINIIHNADQRGEKLFVEDLCASLSDRVAEILTEHTLKAVDRFNLRKVAVAGGVSANSVLRAHLDRACREKGIELFFPPLSLCGDNAAMVGSQAYYEYQAGNRADMSLNAKATMNIEKSF